MEMVNMIFKQKVLKEEKIKLGIIISCVVIPYVAIAIINFINQYNFRMFITIFLIALFPILIIILLIGFKNLEWYIVYNNKIEVRNIYGIKNIVFYDSVLFIEELEINLTTRGMNKKFYIFNDGRKNNNSIFNINSCYNNKKFNLRIYKTKELENYINNNLHNLIYK